MIQVLYLYINVYIFKASEQVEQVRLQVNTITIFKIQTRKSYFKFLCKKCIIKHNIVLMQVR